MVTVTQPRNVRQHRLLFALLGLVMDNLPLDQRGRFPSKDKLLDAIKIGTGHTETVIGLDGRAHLKPRSIAFDTMDQSEFGEFFRAAVEVIREYVINDLDLAALDDEIEDILN